MTFRQFSDTLLLSWVRLVRRAAPAVLLAVFAVAFFAARYTMDNIAVNTDTEDMLSEQLPWRILDQEYERLFPQYDNNILIVIEAATPDQARDAATMLHERLQAEQDLFEFVYYPNALPVFRESGLLYLERDALQDLSDDLAEAQPLLARLARDPTLRGLFGVLGDALNAADNGALASLEPMLTDINRALEALRDGRPYRLSWQQLMSGDGDRAHTGPYREFILTQPRLDYAELLPATPAINSIHRAWAESGSIAGAELRLTGATMLAHEEMLSVMQGTKTAVALALGLVTCIMVAGLGSVILTLVTVLSLVTGLICTAAFALLTVTELNLISVAFAVLYIGLGVDFAIHYCLRYREHIIDGADRAQALEQTSVNIGDSLFLCAVSTAIGFFAFIPTDYTGVAELGWIAGAGMFVSFAITLTVIPALLTLLPYSPGARRARPAGGASAARLVEQHAGKIIGATVGLALVGAATLGGLRFDHNPLNLQARDGAALNAYRELLADNALTPWTAIMIAADYTEAHRYRTAFTQSGLVEKVVTVADFIPADQEEKLFIIDEMGLLLGDLSAAPPDPETQTGTARLATLRGFLQILQETGTDEPVHAQLRANLAELLERQSARADRASTARGREPDDGSEDQLARLEQMLLASLPGRLQALDASLNADYISPESLPEQLKRLWVSADGKRRIEIYPQQDLQDSQALREFVREAQSIAPAVTGTPIINLEASDAVATAFRQAFLYALLAITLMLYLLLKRKKDVLLVLLPLLTAALLTGALSVLIGLPLNFANVIALPLLLGIGVDSGIHIVHRYRTDLPDGKNILATSSARAVVVSALTTMGGVGNLALSPHAGTASMGLLLTLGIGVTLLCMLALLPALLAVAGRQKSGRH